MVSDYEYERRIQILINNYQKIATTKLVDSSTKINNVSISTIAGSRVAYPRIIKWLNEILNRKKSKFEMIYNV